MSLNLMFILARKVTRGLGTSVERGLGTSVVMNLTDKIRNKNHHVYFDNFFTSINLLLDLQRRGIYSNGTMRHDQKGFPAEFKKYVKKGLPERGQHAAVQCGNFVYTLWQDTKPFFLFIYKCTTK